jgi:hypothetical protein
MDPKPLTRSGMRTLVLSVTHPHMQVRPERLTTRASCYT